MYTVKQTPKQNKPGAWNSSIMEIYQDDQKIGEYLRHYPSYGKETFCPISYDGKDYALYSADYTRLSLMELPSCKKITLKEECIKQISQFCPVEIRVPQFYVAKYKHDDGSDWYLSGELAEKEKKEDLSIYYSTLGLALGCFWGDDSSWKLNLIDLSNIAEGEYGTLIITKIANGSMRISQMH